MRKILFWYNSSRDLPASSNKRIGNFSREINVTHHVNYRETSPWYRSWGFSFLRGISSVAHFFTRSERFLAGSNLHITTTLAISRLYWVSFWIFSSKSFNEEFILSENLFPLKIANFSMSTKFDTLAKKELFCLYFAAEPQSYNFVRRSRTYKGSYGMVATQRINTLWTQIIWYLKDFFENDSEKPRKFWYKNSEWN